LTKALILGINGQDGSYLAEYLLEKGYTVFGWTRDTPSSMTNIENILSQLTLTKGDLFDQTRLVKCLEKFEPDEIYHLASPSAAGESWNQALYYGQTIAIGTLNILDAIRLVRIKTKLLIADTSELFGNASSVPQNENTPFNPRNPYGSAKLYAHNLAMNYRDHYGLFISTAILFNHESPRRPNRFVSRKITQGAARISLHLERELNLGNLDVHKDWGYAPEFVKGMWSILQQERAENFVIGTGELHTVRNICEIAFSYLGLDYREFIVIDPRFQRRDDDILLAADSSKAQKILGWKPQKKFEEIIKEMVDHDLVLEKQVINKPL
jgi:GDPmannose 4,6-dehydratase